MRVLLYGAAEGKSRLTPLRRGFLAMCPTADALDAPLLDPKQLPHQSPLQRPSSRRSPAFAPHSSTARRAAARPGSPVYAQTTPSGLTNAAVNSPEEIRPR